METLSLLDLDDKLWIMSCSILELCILIECNLTINGRLEAWRDTDHAKLASFMTVLAESANAQFG